MPVAVNDARSPACLRRLHWAVAAGVAVQLALGWGSETGIDGTDGMRLLRVPKATAPGGRASKTATARPATVAARG